MKTAYELGRENGIQDCVNAIEAILNKQFLPNPLSVLKPTEIKEIRDDMRAGAQQALAVVVALQVRK